MDYFLLKYQRQNQKNQRNTLSRFPNIVNVGNDRFAILGVVSVSSGYSPEQLKGMWTNADTILRNGEEYYICSKLIEAEFDVIKQMYYDMEVAKTIKVIDENYNIYEAVRSQAKAETGDASV